LLLSYQDTTAGGHRVAIVVTTLFDDPIPLLKLLAKQTLKPTRIIVAAGSRITANKLRELLRNEAMNIPVDIIYVRPDLREHVGIRVGKTINQALQLLNLHEIDYLLKIDADVLIKTDYLEKCVKMDADLVGLGPFMLIKAKPFFLLLKGRWPETPADDAYIAMAFRAGGLRVTRFPEGILVKRKGGATGSWRYYYLRGVDDWKVGFDPLREFMAVLWLIIRRRSMLPVFTLIAYIAAMLKGEKMYEFGVVNFTNGVRRYTHVVKRLTRILIHMTYFKKGED